MATIKLPNCDLEIVELSANERRDRRKDFYIEPEFTDEYSFDSYIGEKRETEYRLRTVLGRIWTAEDDFVVADDENIAFTLCGGIYSARPVCQDYLAILYRVLQAAPMRDLWVYSTAVEIVKPQAETVDFAIFCSIRVHQNKLYLNEQQINFDFFNCFRGQSKRRQRESPELWRNSVLVRRTLTARSGPPKLDNRKGGVANP